MPSLGDFRPPMRYLAASTVLPHRRCSEGHRINQNRPVSKHRRHIPESQYRSKDMTQPTTDFHVFASKSRDFCSSAE
jgi:hypothetical protein